MSLKSNLESLATRIGTEFKTLRTLTGALSGLTTTSKASLVAAINEVNAKPTGGGGAAINDAAVNATQTWSSQKSTDAITAAVNALVDGAPGAIDTLKELAAALGNDPSFATTVTTALGKRLRFDDAQTLTAAEKIQANGNLGSLSLVQSGDPEADLVAVFVAGLA